MTTIIAIEQKDRVIFGSDSQATMGLQQTPIESGKVFTRGDYTIAAAGTLQLLQVLKHAELPRVEDADIDRHVSTVFIPTLHSLLAEAELKPEEAGLLLMAVKRRVYLIVGGTYLRNASGVYAIGSGSTYALGALAHVSNPGYKDIEHALKVAAKYDIGTSGPFKVSFIR